MAKTPTVVLLDEAQERLKAAEEDMMRAIRENFSEEGGRRLAAAIDVTDEAHRHLTLTVMAVVTALKLL